MADSEKRYRGRTLEMIFKEGARAARDGAKKVDCPEDDKEARSAWLKGYDDHKKSPGRGTAFQNGVTKAVEEIMNKATAVGVRLENKSESFVIRSRSGKPWSTHSNREDAEKELSRLQSGNLWKTEGPYEIHKAQY